ncbi:T9SS type A sorting domain-containing protein [Flavobacterium azooxidireducens]|uniref:T9SS type A sorting domain-containing protein n=1 Tax=Flavobacterium azooxidireducens TaxID=1871076 RepID=A0ABY4KKU6_9FLAO|nr:T9SS type A sorting domain-containing protein [Flavobacterium azooxidireducens]UPQ80020.1 T9SS type A sorting domain-containing protein [Flavobacterium azooxidireducens]
MKTKITIFALFSILFSFAQKGEYDLLKEHTQTKILYDQVFDISKITKTKKDEISAMYFRQVYHEIQRADYLQRLPKYEILKKEADDAFFTKQIPLSILISEVETIKTEALENNTISKNNNQFVLNNPSADAFQNHEIALMAPLVSRSKNKTVEFILKDKNIFNTTSKNIQAIYISFIDESLWQTVIINQPIHVDFGTSGKKSISFKIEFTNGESKIIKSTFEIQGSSTIANRNGNEILAETITASIPYQGYGESAAYLGQGEYEIYLDNVDQVLDKPIFLIDGFDPGDTRNTELIYSLLNYGGTDQNLADIVRNEGFDIVVLNFPQYSPADGIVIDGGADFIQRNAMILVELINQINAQKVGTEKNVVIGPSMGGLISRYALRYMEQNDMEHDTRLYISFDSPHLGANVPIGFQHLFNYMANGPLGDVTLQEIVNSVLSSPAAKQMLLDHYTGHLQTGSATEFDNATQLPTGAPNFRTAFQNELNTMGFPTETRNVAISNGSGSGTMTGTPGMFVLNDYIVNATDTQRARFDVRFTPPAGVSNQLVSRFRGQQFVFIWLTIFSSQANATSPATSSGLDSAPGGMFNVADFAEAGSGNPTLDAFLDNLAIDRFCFIPTLSSLAISNPNWYANVTDASITPFAATFVPTENEDHVTLSAGNVEFALEEILNEPLSVEQPILSETFLIKNPIKNTIEMYSSSLLSNVTISIVDASGKKVFSQNNISIEGNHQLDVNLSNGFYLIKIESAERNFVQKLIKN